MLRPSTRGGVPVFMRSALKPCSTNCSVMPRTAFSPARPPPNCFSPTCMRPFRNVPAVTTTDRERIVAPNWVLTPTQEPFSISNSTTASCQKSSLGVCSSISRHFSAKRMRSFWVRGDHIAGPLDRFNMRNWMALWSLTMPEYPPIASISRTIWPLAIPPIAGLQDI